MAGECSLGYHVHACSKYSFTDIYMFYSLVSRGAVALLDGRMVHMNIFFSGVQTNYRGENGDRWYDTNEGHKSPQ